MTTGEVSDGFMADEPAGLTPFQRLYAQGIDVQFDGYLMATDPVAATVAYLRSPAVKGSNEFPSFRLSMIPVAGQLPINNASSLFTAKYAPRRFSGNLLQDKLKRLGDITTRIGGALMSAVVGQPNGIGIGEDHSDA